MHRSRNIIFLLFLKPLDAIRVSGMQSGLYHLRIEHVDRPDNYITKIINLY